MFYDVVSTSMSVVVSKVALVGFEKPVSLSEKWTLLRSVNFFVQTEGLRVFGAPGDIITQTI